MPRIMMRVAYDGTEYSGWQVQPNAITIEGVLNAALSELTGEEIQVIGASRTDAGVHSLGNVCVFDTNTRIPPEKICFAVNNKLPQDIRVIESGQVPDDFHPRHCDSVKTYEYRIWNDKFPSPTLRRESHFTYRKINVDNMRAAAEKLVGEHDFKSYCTPKDDVENTVRTIYFINVEFSAFSEPYTFKLRIIQILKQKYHVINRCTHCRSLLTHIPYRPCP